MKNILVTTILNQKLLYKNQQDFNLKLCCYCIFLRFSFLKKFQILLITSLFSVEDPLKVKIIKTIKYNFSASLKLIVNKLTKINKPS